MVTINTNLSLPDYLEELKGLQVKTRDKIISELGISLKTFYNKLNNDSFSPLEKTKISELTGISKDILFPQKEEVA